MNTDLHNAAEQWVGLIGDELVCHRGVIQFPMRKGWKRGHRMVVLPDYQGVGIGTAFENYTSQHYADLGFIVNVTTTTPSLAHALIKSPKWSLFRFGRNKSDPASYGKYYKEIERNAKAVSKRQSNNRITYSFYFIK